MRRRHASGEALSSLLTAHFRKKDCASGIAFAKVSALSPNTDMITETITGIATNILDKTSYAGAAGLMALESMIAPVPSEAVMPFVGFQVADGKWNLWLAILSTSIGSIIGSLLSYAMGYYGGKPLVLKIGRYLLLNVRDLERTEQFFHRKSGVMTIFIARFVPVVRHFISIPAGMGRTPMVPFLIVTFIGATAWNTFLLVCGMKLREHWPTVQKYSHKIDIVIVVLMVLAAIWWVKVRLPRFRQSPPPSGGAPNADAAR